LSKCDSTQEQIKKYTDTKNKHKQYYTQQYLLGIGGGADPW